MRTIRKARVDEDDRNTDDLSDHLSRLFWIFVRLHVSGTLEKRAYFERFETAPRTFQRDLRQLREIGLQAGFVISNVRAGRVHLDKRSPQFAWLHESSRKSADLLRRIAEAFGGPVRAEIAGALGDLPASSEVSFLQIRTPRPVAESVITSVFDTLKRAATAHARMTFTYTTASGRRSERTVEPYHVVVREGRYYLVAFDLDRRDWRHFALDAISGAFRPSGSFVPRAVPASYLADQAVGWIQGKDDVAITIAISPAIAAAVSASAWQPGQQITPLADGSLHITLAFRDIAEGVRFALRFGPEATVIAPEPAVRLAVEMLDAMLAAQRQAAKIVPISIQEPKPQRSANSSGVNPA
jgi:predicted DNA-binding transcriptional regulator YafY